MFLLCNLADHSSTRSHTARCISILPVSHRSEEGHIIYVYIHNYVPRLMENVQIGNFKTNSD